jgi:hypothetical protein
MLSLGTYPEVALGMARDRREAARRLIASGIDPSQARRTEKAEFNKKKIEDALEAKGEPGPGSFEAVAREWLSTVHKAKVSAGPDGTRWIAADPGSSCRYACCRGCSGAASSRNCSACTMAASSGSSALTPSWPTLPPSRHGSRRCAGRVGGLCQATIRRTASSADYLSRYTHRMAISNPSSSARPGPIAAFLAYAPTGLPSVRRTTMVDERGGKVLPCTFDGQVPVGCWMLMKNVRRSGV